MFKRRDIPIEDSLKRACEDNGLIYSNNNCEQRKTVTLINESGEETVVNNKNMEVVHSENVGK